MIQHHLPEDVLLEVSAGTAASDVALLAGCHLTLCPACRDRLAELETVGAALVDGLAPAPPDDLEALLDNTLAKLDAPDPTPARRFDPSGVLPGPLAERIGPFDQLRWQRFLPGVGLVTVPLPDTSGMPLRLFRLKAGLRVADHGHDGREIAMVLTGGFTDDGGHFGRGDVCDRHGRTPHRQQIDPGEPCVVLTAAEGTLVPLTFVGRLARLIRRV